MPSQQDPAGDREVFRSTGSVVLWWTWVVIAVATVIDLAVQAGGHSAVEPAAVLVAITGVVYACALRPRIVADEAGITVANPLREYLVPWGRVEKVDAVNAVRVHCTPAPGASKGKIVHSWAVQSSPRSARRGELRARKAVQQTTRPVGYGHYPAEAQEALRRNMADFTAHKLEEQALREREAGAEGGRLEVRWSWVSIAAMLVPLALLLVVVFA